MKNISSIQVSLPRTDIFIEWTIIGREHLLASGVFVLHAETSYWKLYLNIARSTFADDIP